MAEQQDEGGKLAWFIAGAAVGAAIGLLYAPKTGKETREYISQKTDQTKETLTETGKEVYEKGREIYDRGKQMADDAAQLLERGRKLMRGEEPAPPPATPA